MPPARPRVLMSVRTPRPTTNPYVVQLVEALAPHAEVAWFSWPRALAGRYDLLHWHWPEVALRRSGALARVAARLRFAALLARLALTRTPVVRTLHNLAPHEGAPRADRALLALAQRQTTWWVALTARDAAGERTGRTTLAPHGHYRAWSARPGLDASGGTGGTAPVAGRLLFCGLVRPYKGVENLLVAFADLDDPTASLHVTGACPDADLAASITARAAADPRALARLAHLDDADLVAAVHAAQLVVLPYREMHSSGALLLALSLGRPVLVPRTPVTDDLAAEVGAAWVQRYDGDLSSSHLSAALSAVAGLAEGARLTGGADGAGPHGPDLSARGWPAAGAAHARAYAAALAARPVRARRR